MRTTDICVHFTQPVLSTDTDDVFLHDKLIIHFQKQHVSGGGEVRSVDITDKDQHGYVKAAVVSFTDSEAVEAVLSVQTHTITLEGKHIPLRIEPIAMASSDQYDDSDDNFESWEKMNYFPDAASSEEEDLYGAAAPTAQQSHDAPSPQHESPKKNVSIPSSGGHNIREAATPISRRGDARYDSPSSGMRNTQRQRDTSHRQDNEKHGRGSQGNDQPHSSFAQHDEGASPSGGNNGRSSDTSPRTSQGGSHYGNPSYQAPVHQKQSRPMTNESHLVQGNDRDNHRPQGRPLKTRDSSEIHFSRNQGQRSERDDHKPKGWPYKANDSAEFYPSDNCRDKDTQGGKGSDNRKHVRGQPQQSTPGNHPNQSAFVTPEEYFDEHDDGEFNGPNWNMQNQKSSSAKPESGMDRVGFPGKAQRVGTDRNDNGQRGRQWRGGRGRGCGQKTLNYPRPHKGGPPQVNHSSGDDAEIFDEAKSTPGGYSSPRPKPSDRSQSRMSEDSRPASSNADTDHHHHHHHSPHVSDSETDEQSATVEVSKFKTTTTEDTLRMYFESKRKSGGGDIDEFVFNQDVLTVKFCEPEAADRVVRRPHKLEGATLTVIPVEKKKDRPRRPFDKYQLLLTDIPDGVGQETLLLFIEGRTKIEEDPEIVYGEQPGTAMIRYSSHIEDIDGVIKNFTKRKLKGATVKASCVEFPDCILVQNLKPGTTQDTVELYFENERKSGGDIVREVQLDEEKKQAIVYFEDWKVVERVISQQRHILSKSVLKVTIYQDCLGTEISTDGPTPRLPNPVVVPVKPEIAEYLMENGSPHRSHLEQELQKLPALMEWPHEQKVDSLKLTPDDGQATDASVWRDWTKRATTAMQGFFQDYDADEFRVEADTFWEKICEKLEQINLDSVRPVLRQGKSAILLIGPSADVRRVKKQLKAFVDELEKIAERERQIIKKKILLQAEKFKLLILCRIKDEVEKEFGNVRFILIPDTKEVECEGMQADVAEAQLAIYASLDRLAHHTTEISSNKSRFMKHVQDKIHEIFASKNIRAACNIEGCKLTVSGATQQDTHQAIVYIKANIVERTLKAERDATLNVLQDPKGTKCLRDINNQRAALAVVNMEARCVEITGFKNDVDNALGVIGEFIETNVILEKRIPLIRGKVRYLTEHYGRDLISISDDNRQHMVQITPVPGGRQSGFRVTATEQGMAIAVQSLDNLIRKVVDKQLPVNKPGIPRLLRQDKGKRFLKAIEKDCECIVDTNSAGLEDSFDEDVGAAGFSAPRVQILRQHTLPGGCQVMVCKGDLTTESVDAIINAANTKLEHVGGLAKAIVDAGGEIIQKESKAIIREKHRELATGEVVQTSSGKLPCRHVLHVAGPRWDSQTPKPRPGDDPTHEENLLHDSVTNVLREAKRMSLRSVSIPAISSGVYGFPIHLCAKTIVESTAEFCKRNKSSKLQEIRFTNIDQRACDSFLTVFRGQFGEEDRAREGDRFDSIGSMDSTIEDGFHSLRGDSADFTEPTPSESSAIPVRQAGRNTITTTENKTITMKKGDLAAENVDVLVNTTSSSLQLNAGGVSKAILAAAGPALQQECQNGLAQSGQTALGPGGILETGPAALNCKTVYHTVCEHYQGPSSETVLSTLVMQVLQQANQAGHASIAFPAIGTGNLRFPHNVAAKLMYEAAIKFSQQNPQGTLVDIRFVVYNRDRPTIQAFETEMQNLVHKGLPNEGAAEGRARKPTRKLKQPSASYEERPQADAAGASSYADFRTSPMGTTQMKIGPICVQLGHGDLTRESTEVIVNSVGDNLDLGGPVSKAIIREGGRSIEAECESIKKKGGRHVAEGVVKTRAGTLNCSSIIHVATPRNLDQLKDKVLKALKLAEKEKCKSIAFPALGTGNIGGDPAKAASVLLDAIGEFACSGKVEHLLLIKLTIFQRAMLTVFQDTMNDKEGESYEAPKSFLQRGADLFKWAWSKASVRDVPLGVPHRDRRRDGRHLMGGEGDDGSQGTDVDDLAMETMILHIFAGSVRNLQQALDKIEEFIEEEFTQDELMYESEVWGELTKKKLDKICALGRKNSVNIQQMLGGRAKRIILEGRNIDVVTAKSEIQKYFTDIQLQKKRELEDRLMNKEVQWRFRDPDGQFTEYGDGLNPLIERAYQEKKNYKDLDLEGGKIRINFITMKERDFSGAKTDCDIERVDLKKVIASKFALPPNWIPMNPGQNSQVVKLLPTSKEYTDVVATFQGSIGRAVTVIEIKRIQNEELLKQYRAKKQRLDASVKPGVQVEREVYHGTSGDNCDKINTNGFNRSFHGANGTALGKGTYFARDASYSNGYAKPTPPNRYQHMYLCKVLTGEYAIGNNTMIAPPAKPNIPAENYDSVVDRHPNPSVFVVFHDAQALPEYLIVYQ